MFCFRLFVLFALLAFAIPAHAQDCTNPDGNLGDMLYNGDYSVFQGCTPAGWLAFHEVGDFCPGSGLVGHWRFNESGNVSTAADSSLSGNDGTLTGFPADPSANWVSGKLGNALDFDGTDDVVNAGSGSSLKDLPAISICAWIFRHTLGENGTGLIYDQSDNIQFFASSGSPSDRLRFVVKYDTTALSVRSAVGTAPLNVWQHACVTWDGSTSASIGVKIYLDGSETTYSLQGDAAGVRLSDTGDALIGSRNTGSQNFDGLIDDVRVYDRVLPQAEVSALYNGGAGCR